MTEELKPCPFCGGEAELMSHGVRCKKPNCGSITNVLELDKAIEAWNSRI